MSVRGHLRINGIKHCTFMLELKAEPGKMSVEDDEPNWVLQGLGGEFLLAILNTDFLA